MADTPDQADTTADSSASGGGSRPVLGLRIPDQAPARPDHFLLDPKETEAWFDGLPLANIGETARLVYGTLVEFNRTELPHLVRAKTIERFRAPVEYIVDNLQRHFIDVGLPLSSKGWKTARLAIEMEREMAIGYKIIAQRMISGDSADFDRRLLVVALHHALVYQGLTLLQNALIYTSWPEGIWREINSTFAYASQNAIHTVAVKDGNDKEKRGTSTIEDLFKGLMLFASANPHRLRQSHAQLLFSMLPHWANLAVLMKSDDGQGAIGRFNVDLWDDAAPLHNSLRLPAPGRRIAILDVSKLLQKLHTEFDDALWEARAGIKSAQRELTRPLLRQLILAWSRPPDRRFVRTRLKFELSVVAGLHAIYGNLHSNDDGPYEPARASVFKLDEAEEPLRPDETQVDWSSGSLDKAGLSDLDDQPHSRVNTPDSYLNTSRGEWLSTTLGEFGDNEEATPAKPQLAEDTTQASHVVNTLNESAGGYCIRWQGAFIPRVKIGELIGIASPTDPHRYGLGVIRWIKQTREQELDLGLEVISTHCDSGDVREAPATGKSKPSPSYKCLIVGNQDPGIGPSPNLIMSTMSLETGCDLTLKVGDSERLIRLTQLVEFSSAFARYQYEEKSTDDDTGKRQHGDEFDDLWGSL